MFLVLNFLVPFAFSVLRRYMESPSSSYDDLILDGAKDGLNYLANKDNNTVTYNHAASIGQTQYFGEGK